MSRCCQPSSLGARWTSAPKPELRKELFDHEYRIPEEGDPIVYVLTEWEPVFDAADFMRCGRDLFVQKSNVTNAMGIEWLRRHLSDRGYRIHEIESRCRTPMHIDTTFVPLAPGKVLVNPEYLDISRLPPILKDWDILVAPAGAVPGARMMPLAGEAPFGAGNKPRFTLLAASQKTVSGLFESFSDLLASSVLPPPVGSGISLVRPDGYVACAVAAGDVKSIADYLDGLRRKQ